MQPPALVLVHGLWDTPRLFDRLVAALDGSIPQLLIPHLPHGLGRVSITTMAQWLDDQITANFGNQAPVDLLGFSMGGLISRTWIQRHDGYRRTRRFLCVGSPQQGTLTAQLAPRRWLPSIADMKVGSPFLKSLENDWRQHPEHLSSVDCTSFFCRLDLMVVPGWSAVLPVGPRQAMPVWTHPQLIVHPSAIRILVATLQREASTVST